MALPVTHCVKKLIIGQLWLTVSGNSSQARQSFFYFFLVFDHLWLFGGWGWGSFQLMGFGACDLGPSGFFRGWGFLYKHRRITLGKTLRQASRYGNFVILLIVQHIMIQSMIALVLWYRFCTSGRPDGCVENSNNYFSYFECACSTDGCNAGQSTQRLNLIMIAVASCITLLTATT